MTDDDLKPLLEAVEQYGSEAECWDRGGQHSEPLIAARQHVIDVARKLVAWQRLAVEVETHECMAPGECDIINEEAEAKALYFGEPADHGD